MNFYRCRFLEPESHSITALAFSHQSAGSSTKAPKSLRLAVGRTNGDIEIWNPRGILHELTIKGGRGRSIEGLVFITTTTTSADGNLTTEHSRLFSIGGATTITEWDLSTGLPLAHHDCNAGIVWCIAASPDRKSIVAGCDDGSVVVVDVSGGKGVLEHKRILQRQKSRVLSIVFRSDEQVIAGCADGRIRVYQVSDGRIKSTMRVDKAQDEETLVWSLLALHDGKTLVSGDSTGSVKFWDATHFSLLQSFRAHEADVLSLASNAAGNTIFSAGVDRKIVRYSFLDAKVRRWAVMSSRLQHAKDIRALASYDTRPLSLLISGGVERALVVNSMVNFMDGMFRKIAYTPQAQSITKVGDRILLPTWNDNHVKVWDIDRFPTSEYEAKFKRLASSLTLANTENITDVALSPDAKYLAVANNAEVKLFLLLRHGETTFKVKKIAANALADQGAVVVKFDVSSNNLVLVTPESEILIYSIGKPDGELQEFNYEQQQQPQQQEEEKEDGDGEERENQQADVSGQLYRNNMNRLAFSPDGKYLAVATIAGQVTIVNWATQTKIWTLPRLPTHVCALEFSPDSGSLAVVSAQTKVHVFDVEVGALTAWSRKNTNLLSQEFVQANDKPSGVWFCGNSSGQGGDDDDNNNKLQLWSASWIANVDMTADMPVFRVPKRKLVDGQKSNGTTTSTGVASKIAKTANGITDKKSSVSSHGNGKLAKGQDSNKSD
ncbi:WD40-repeat-containing domain protein [Lipomyces japonicus]|uniref:WD40-repeat-containing domain protein n=1 Tax=Lipomyces japonicus TaxID=56871 RepID=UPI0034CFAB65